MAELKEDEQTMAILPLKCVGECSDEHVPLYFCKACDSEIVYCDECGPWLHRKKSHEWKQHASLIPNIDQKKYQFGERLIIEHIGEQNYRRIAPVYHAAAASTGLGCSVFQQSTTCFDALPKQIAAVKKAAEAAESAKKSLSVSETACKLVAELKQNEKLCVEAVQHAEFVWETKHAKITENVFSWLYDWIFSGDLRAARRDYHKAVELSKAARQEFSESSQKAAFYSKQAEKCAKLAQEKLAESQAATHEVTEAKSFQKSLKNGAKWTVGFIVVEMVWNGYKLGCNEINAKEFSRLTKKSVGKNLISLGANTVGTQIGVGAAYQFGKMFGNNQYAVYAGIGIGLVAGILASSYFGKKFDEWFESQWPSEESEQRQKFIDEALKYFHFSMDEVKNPQKFNAIVIQKKYRKYALEAHPDREGGSTLKWQELSAYYGILTGLLHVNQQNKENKKLDQDDEKAENISALI